MSEWQPIETAPKDGTPVLLYEPSEDPTVHVAEWGIGDWHLCDFDPGYDLVQRAVNPTHWMPLPEPPNHED